MGFPPDNITGAEAEQIERFRRVARRHWNAILSRLPSEHRLKWVAFDLLTGEYEMSDDRQEAIRDLGTRLPRAMIWTEYVPEYHRKPY